MEWPEKLAGYAFEDKVFVEMSDLGGEDRHIALIKPKKTD